MIAYSCGWYNGDICHTYFVIDFTDSFDMLNNALKEMLIYNPNAKVYVHNLAKFDYFLITKVLFDNF